MSLLIKRVFLFALALLVAILISVVLLPLVLILAIVPILFYVLKGRPRQPPTLPKGTVEILPPEKKAKKKPDIRSPADIELEIHVEPLKKDEKGPFESRKPS